MVGDHIIVLPFPAGNDSVPALCKKELLVSDGRIALISRDQIAAVSFLWILHLIRYPAQSFRNSPALATVQGH